jgi:hypothetical protein
MGRLKKIVRSIRQKLRELHLPFAGVDREEE